MTTPWKQYGRYGSVGIELLASMALGYYGGRWLDHKLGTHGWLTWIGFAVGIYAGFRSLFMTAKKMQRDIEAEERAERSAGRAAVAPLPPSYGDDAASSEEPGTDNGGDDGRKP